MFVDMRGSTQLAGEAAAVRHRVHRQPLPRRGVAGGAESRRAAQPVSSATACWRCSGSPPTGTRPAARRPCARAALIATNIDELNQFLSHDLREPIRFGIGIHGGEVIVGDIGYRDHMVFTALGDAVNVAARLQDMTKALACEAVISDEVRVTAGLADDALPAQEVAIRGRNEPMTVRTVEATAFCPRWSTTGVRSRPDRFFFHPFSSVICRTSKPARPAAMRRTCPMPDDAASTGDGHR